MLERTHSGLNLDWLERDQVESYATRKGWDVHKAEKWLGPILNYDPNEV